MRAMDVMTTDVITVGPEMTVQAVANLLAERGISGAPVVASNGNLVGIVSEGICCTAPRSALLVGTASAAAHGGLTISRPTSPATTSNRMGAGSRTS